MAKIYAEFQIIYWCKNPNIYILHAILGGFDVMIILNCILYIFRKYMQYACSLKSTHQNHVLCPSYGCLLVNVMNSKWTGNETLLIQVLFTAQALSSFIIARMIGTPRQITQNYALSKCVIYFGLQQIWNPCIKTTALPKSLPIHLRQCLSDFSQ